MSQRQCLPLDEDDEDNDDQSSDDEMEYDVTQLSAIKYLKKVRSERNRIPEIVTSSSIPPQIEIPTSSSEMKQKVFHKNDPSTEWQEFQIQKFGDLRERIADMKNDPNLTEKIVEELPVDTSIEEECLTYCKENDPLLSVLLAMNQGHLEQVIDVLAAHLNENLQEFLDNVSKASWITKWIYSSLACIYTPLDPELHNSLRVIGKICIQIIDHLKTLPDQPDFLIFLPFNLLLVIIAKYFHQFDLLSL